MKFHLYSFTASMEELGVPLEQRTVLLSIALARAIGYKLPIPTAAVDDVRAYYEDQHRNNVDQTLAKINERIVFDLGEISNLAAAVWTFRYRMVHDPSNPAVRDFLDNMVKVGSKEFPTRVSEYLIRSSDDRMLDKVASAVDASLVPDPVEAPNG